LDYDIKTGKIASELGYLYLKKILGRGGRWEN
jgi:hypothetical protein